MKYSKEELLEMYENMATNRTFAVQMRDAIAKGYCRVAFHSGWGQEAVQTGIAYAMTDKEWFVATHRSQGVLMHKLGKFKFISEIFCRKTGVREGLTFDSHINDFEHKILPQCALIGANQPIYTGFAWGLKQKKSEDAVVIEVGDGACSEGCTWEGWNLASLYKVPVCYVVVNNEWAMSVYQPDETPNPNISEKAAPLGLETQIVDGNDVLAVREAVEKGIKMAHNDIPNIVELKTLRWDTHLIGQRAFKRPDEEKLEDAMKNDDPLIRFGDYLKNNNLADDELLTEMKNKAEKEISETIEKAAQEGTLTPDKIFNKNLVYASPETGGDL